MNCPVGPDYNACLRYVRVLLSALLLLLAPQQVSASPPNQLYKVDIRPKGDYTRIIVRLDAPPRYSVSELPGHRLRLAIRDTQGTLFRKYRNYSDNNIGGLVFSRRGADMLITFAMAAGAGWHDVSRAQISAITLDVGQRFKHRSPEPYLPGREKIWHGVEKLVRDFDPPVKTEFLFQPTDPKLLKGMLDVAGQQSFMAAEAALYKGYFSEAEEAFTAFAAKQSSVRPLALYRLGETAYMLQKYPQALAAFREAEKLWPAFLVLNPGVTFSYGDSIARSGNLSAARTLLAGLIGRLADKKFAPVLLVRLADILARQGHDNEALAVYRTVAENFPDNKANLMARLRLNDRHFMDVTPWTFGRVAAVYEDIARKSGDFILREEAQFKYTLLEAIHGEPVAALRQVMAFQRLFPRGVYTTVCRNIRETLVVLVYRQTDWGRDPAGLIRFFEEQNDYLAGCMEQPEFLQKVKQAYADAGRPIELIRFFSGLLERQWAASAGPFLYETIAENADLLGDNVMAEKYMLAFISKFPNHPRARMLFERLGMLYHNEGRYQESRDKLIWLMRKGEKAELPESFYYLARSLWKLKQFAEASRAMTQFLAQTPRPQRLVADAYFVAASALESSGDRKGAIAMLEEGLKLPNNPRSDELTYKAGSLWLLEGDNSRARVYFEQVIAKGSDPDWRKLAQQALGAISIKP